MPTGGSSAPLELLVVGRDAIEAAERQLRSRTSHKRASENDVLHNRIRTIFYDSAFVESVATLYKRSPNNIPLFANLRCGLWYSPNFEGTCYFKVSCDMFPIYLYSKKKQQQKNNDVSALPSRASLCTATHNDVSTTVKQPSQPSI